MEVETAGDYVEIDGLGKILEAFSVSFKAEIAEVEIVQLEHSS